MFSLLVFGLAFIGGRYDAFSKDVDMRIEFLKKINDNIFLGNLVGYSAWLDGWAISNDAHSKLNESSNPRFFIGVLPKWVKPNDIFIAKGGSDIFIDGKRSLAVRNVGKNYFQIFGVDIHRTMYYITIILCILSLVVIWVV